MSNSYEVCKRCNNILKELVISSKLCVICSELDMKKKLRNLKGLWEKFDHEITKTKLMTHKKFTEIRHQIEEQRQTLIARIDHMTSELVAKVNGAERIFQNALVRYHHEYTPKDIDIECELACLHNDFLKNGIKTLSKINNFSPKTKYSTKKLIFYQINIKLLWIS